MNFWNILCQKQISMNQEIFLKMKKICAFHKKYYFHSKILERTLQKMCVSRFFVFFQKFKKITEFNKKQSLPRIQVIPSSDVSDEEKKGTDTPPYNEFCKDIDKSIIYNQVFLFLLLLWFFKKLKIGICRENLGKKNNFPN